MHIAFVSLGAFGHINPTLSLTTELVNQGFSEDMKSLGGAQASADALLKFLQR